MMKQLALALVLASFQPIAHADKKPTAPVAVNVTGTWNANFAGGIDLLLHQNGNLVWGTDKLGYLIRGDWSDGRLTLFYRTDFKGEPGSCSAPAIAVVTSRGTATRLEGIELLESGHTRNKTLTRASPDPGKEVSYPYGAELKVCGSLTAHDLVFDSSSDKLKGTEWPLLGAVADVMKQDTALKIQILGHTDNTGDAAKNKALSQRRADAIKKVLVGIYKADAARIATKGWGQEQPIAANDTDDGRAVNRRVEILVAH
jgi:outer membrane protein OmpA-like peptidoglycan-associated protein